MANTGGSGGSRLHRDHQVEFYETAEYLADSVCGFVEPALRDGDAAIVVATEAHRHDFAAELTARGIDVQTAADSGRFLALDAAETLALFMADGRPDPARFTQALVPLIERAATGGRAVRIYGEMVALLWAEGNIAGAIALEDLWNELGALQPFSPLCAYPATAFYAAETTGSFRAVCEQHALVA